MIFFVNATSNPLWPYFGTTWFVCSACKTFLKRLTMLSQILPPCMQPTLLYKVPSKSTVKNFVTNVYCFYLQDL